MNSVKGAAALPTYPLTNQTTPASRAFNGGGEGILISADPSAREVLIMKRIGAQLPGITHSNEIWVRSPTGAPTKLLLVRPGLVRVAMTRSLGMSSTLIDEP
jgi:hypothetical protein